MPRTRRHKGARTPSALASTVLVIVVALVASLVGLGWATLGTDWMTRRQANQRVDEALGLWNRGAPRDESPAPGDVIAVLDSPRLGIRWPVLAGIAPDQLDNGLGWYPQTALPGQDGNTAIAGRRVTHGSPLRKLLDLRPGDQITLTDATGAHVYRVTARPAQVSSGPRGAWVLDPVPGSQRPPATSMLTLTTAADMVATDRRGVVFAELVRQTRR